MPFFPTYIKPVIDLAITLSIWTYYIFGYICFFAPFYAVAAVVSENRETAFQHLNHLFYKGMFLLVRAIPRLRIHVHDDVRTIRSSVIVCNHLSYLDPILLISLFEQQKTIVKSDFFKLPVFGWVLNASGYLPSDASGRFAPLVIERVEGMAEYLASGGNLFIFPEGTRSRDGKIGPFNKGAFRIAARCDAPIQVLQIRNTDKLFRPGKFLFNTCVRNDIEVKLIASIAPDYKSKDFSLSELMRQVRDLFENKSESSGELK